LALFLYEIIKKTNNIKAFLVL